jgi:hypothetical protein
VNLKMGHLSMLVVGLLASMLLAADAASFGIDFSIPVSLAQLQCTLSQGLFISMRAYHDGDGGGCDSNGDQAISLAYQAGYNTQGGVLPYIFPNAPTMVSGQNTPEGEVQAALWCATAAGFPHGGIYWLDIEQDPYNPWPDCDTSASYILRMIAELFKYGPTVGVYSSAYEWGQVTCQSYETADGRDRIANFTKGLEAAFEATREERERNMQRHAGSPRDPLEARINTNQTIATTYGNPVKGGGTVLCWYAHYDNNPSFSDFTPFGPFKTPFAKQYSDQCGNCGISSDCDWSPI